MLKVLIPSFVIGLIFGICLAGIGFGIAFGILVSGVCTALYFLCK